jgi:hypothetical protein
MKRCALSPLACRFFESVLPAPQGEFLLGDLLEEYALRLQSESPFAARRWFWSQTWRSILPLLWSALRNENWLLSMGFAAGVYVAMETLKFIADLLILKLFDPGQAARIALAPVIFLTAAALGGCIAARIRRLATIFLALMVMMTVATSVALKICTIPVPWWYPVGFLVLGPLSVLLTPAVVQSLRPAKAK